jgi:hypothetical protein
MGAGGMLGIVAIIALVAWGVFRCVRGSNKVNPEESTPGVSTYIGKTKVAPFTTTGIEDLETKVPSEDNIKKPAQRGGVLQDLTPINRVLPLAPNLIGKPDKSVKIVKNYEPLTTKNEDQS